ncbi:ECF transporter S component [Ureibacillus sp. FSL K6-8385]|uniref:ECF transporter S component n=1 Tax=Ureibacillus terrenus TaxID=118246 RepID=A0A540V3V4_9BACL|nr:ECF transporter S component [Ureibacillus terrenus]MED3661786.1 ECF transporter S component [Ureibacillus terrenus]MED3763089.1 ECF transporter S component [Ureibacillus terrenus]TQE91398.1 ECF transporter S component [Ureibacillus terrenus]
MQNTNPLTKQRSRTVDLTIQSILIALVFLSTLFINIKLPIASNGGLVHLGTAMLFIASILFGPKKGAIAGAAGMGLFDLVGGWLVWAPITIISRALQGYIVGKIAWSNGSRGESFVKNLMATIVSIPVMVGVYYIGEAIMFSSWIMPLASIPGDLVQNAVGIIIAIPVCVVLKKIPYVASFAK